MERTNRSRKHLENVLCLQEICHLNDRKVALKEDNFKYLIGQMDLRSIVGDFIGRYSPRKTNKDILFCI